MIDPKTEADLHRIWEEGERKVQVLEQELVRVKNEMAACELLLSNHKTNGNAKGSETLAHAHIRPNTLVRCTSHMDAFREIARRSGGVVRMSEAGRLVKEAGLTKGKASSITSSMYTRLNASDEWEYVEPGTFRLLAYVNDDPEPNGQEGEEWQGELSTTVNGDVSPRISPDDGALVVGRVQITA